MREKMSRIVVVAWEATLSRHEVLTHRTRLRGSYLPNENQHESSTQITRRRH